MRYRLKSFDELAKMWPIGKANSVEGPSGTFTLRMDEFSGLEFEHDFKKGGYGLPSGHVVSWWMCEELV